MGPLTPRSGIILPGEMLLMPIIISRMIHPLFGEDGLLNLKFMKDETDPRGYKSGSIRTDSGKFDFTYGKVEIKAKFSSGNGSWPAIWMMPASSEYGGWPASGEIDIMEHIKDLDVAVQTVHTTGTEQRHILWSFRV